MNQFYGALDFEDRLFSIAYYQYGKYLSSKYLFVFLHQGNKYKKARNFSNTHSLCAYMLE